MVINTNELIKPFSYNPFFAAVDTSIRIPYKPIYF